MSKTLLIIHSYAGGHAQLNWTWPHYLTSGWDILGVTPTDASHPWPRGVRSVSLTENGYIGTSTTLVRRLVATFEYVLRPEFDAYSDFCIIEYDGFFLQKPPQHPGGFHTSLAGGCIAGFQATRFFHTPWWPDRAAARIIVDAGNKLIAAGELERGSPDLFLGLIVDRTGLPWTQTHTWSVNGGDFTRRRAAAIRPIKDGIWYLHGIRTKSELEWCLAHRP